MDNKQRKRYNTTIHSKLKNFGIYKLIELNNATNDSRFKKLAQELVKEIYEDLLNETDRDYNYFLKSVRYSADFYSKEIQEELESLSKLSPLFHLSERYEELHYIMLKLELPFK